MSVHRPRPTPVRGPRRAWAGAAALVLAAVALSACESGSAEQGQGPVGSSDGPTTTTSSSAGTPTAGGSEATDDPTESATPVAPVGALQANVRKGASGIAVDKVLSVTADNAELSSVSVRSASGRVEGDIAADGTSWTATSRLEPGTAYTLKAVGEDANGTRLSQRAEFNTVDLSLDQQTYPSVAPLPGETVGVGMPVIVDFDVPVSDKASFEKHMSVTTTPAQPGAWHWMSDTEAHWRPKKYWQAGTKVHVAVDVNSVPAGNGIYGQESRDLDFKIGDAHVYRVNAETHQMQVRSNGKLLRTIPITTGKAGFETRTGTKVIIEKFDSKRMNSETVGIPAGDPNSYDIDNVQWAMRLTYSGEFVHAAPWSVGSQGSENVSHGCTGMSTDNAYWLYQMTRRGDVVEYTGTGGDQMTLDNGYGDWNESFRDYKQGSAL